MISCWVVWKHSTTEMRRKYPFIGGLVLWRSMTIKLSVYLDYVVLTKNRTQSIFTVPNDLWCVHWLILTNFYIHAGVPNVNLWGALLSCGLAWWSSTLKWTFVCLLAKLPFHCALFSCLRSLSSTPYFRFLNMTLRCCSSYIIYWERRLYWLLNRWRNKDNVRRACFNQFDGWRQYKPLAI